MTDILKRRLITVYSRGSEELPLKNLSQILAEEQKTPFCANFSPLLGFA
jgi:hypothetical protein